MSLSGSDILFESIQIRDGQPRRMDLHEERMNRSRKHFFGSPFTTSLEDVIHVPEEMRMGLVKCKLVYGETISNISFSRYTPRVHNGVVVSPVDEALEYSFKYTRRPWLAELESQYPDKAVILSRGGFLTDATYANIALFDGSRWFTPNHCLLNGVMRQWLLERGIISEAEIREHDLAKFTSLKLINAMLEWDGSTTLPLHPSNFH